MSESVSSQRPAPGLIPSQALVTTYPAGSLPLLGLCTGGWAPTDLPVREACMFRPWGSPACAQCLPWEAGTTNRIPFFVVI